MLLGVSVVLAGMLSSAPRRDGLVPSLLELAPPASVLLTEAPSSHPSSAEKHFKTGWFIAGLAGGLLTSLGAVGTWGGCPHDPNSPPKHATAIAIAAISIGLGTSLGYAEAKDLADTRGLIIGFDILGPAAAAIALATKCP